MRLEEVWRSTPFRLALLFAAMFLGAFMLTGIAVYQLVRWELLQRHDQTVLETYAVVAAAYGDRDLTDLLDAVGTYVGATPERDRVFLVLAPDGRVLAGNVPAVPVPDGWSDVAGARLGLETDLPYRLLAGEVGRYRLVVGLGYQEIDDLETIALASFAWAFGIVVALAIAGGALIAARAQRRLDAVRDTMRQVSHGALAARIPLSGKGDDIDLLSRDINEALERLAATVEGMRQVSTDIAHDLKTPLNRLKMSVEEALSRQASGLAVVDELEAASAEADRINRTFEALLRIAQIESGARRARFKDVDLSGVLAFMTEIYRDVAEDDGQVLLADLRAGEGTVVQGDWELLTQMYANLIENAIRHCPKGTRIRLGIEATASGLATTVEDDGPGIPEVERSRVFRRLYRLEKSRTSPGSGLGLSLVKAVADLHGAEVALEEAVPGLRVVVRFGRISLTDP